METLNIPRNEWFKAPTPDTYLLWLAGGGKIAYYPVADEFAYWSIDGSPREGLGVIEEWEQLSLMTKLRQVLFETMSGPTPPRTRTKSEAKKVARR